MDGEAELLGLEKIEIFETGVGRQAEVACRGNGARGGSGDFVGKPDLNDMTGFGALDETQNALGNKAAKGLADEMKASAPDAE